MNVAAHGIAARIAIFAEGAYHAGVAGNAHNIARVAAGCLLLLMLCRWCERRLAVRLRAWRLSRLR